LKEKEIPALSLEETEELCKIAESSARKFVLSGLPPREISDFDVTVDIEGTRPIKVNVEVEIELSQQLEGVDVQMLANEAVKHAFLAIEEHLRKIACKSRK
jgi:hypothetical protein